MGPGARRQGLLHATKDEGSMGRHSDGGHDENAKRTNS